MNNYLWVFVAVLGIVALIFVLKRVKKSPERTIDLYRKAQASGLTPSGIQIYGMSLSVDEKVAVDAGFRRAVAVGSECRGYANKLNPSDWRVFVVPSTLSPEWRVPSYCYPYPNDCEKSNNFIIAGEFLPDAGDVIAIAQPQGQTGFTAEVVYNEFEHGLAFHNNQNDYMVGGTPGHIHPLWVDCRTGFIKQKSLGLTCGQGVN